MRPGRAAAGRRRPAGVAVAAASTSGSDYCRCHESKRFAYCTKLSTSSAELRAVASLRSVVFKDEYDRYVVIDDAIAPPQVSPLESSPFE